MPPPFAGPSATLPLDLPADCEPGAVGDRQSCAGSRLFVGGLGGARQLFPRSVQLAHRQNCVLVRPLTLQAVLNISCTVSLA